MEFSSITRTVREFWDFTWPPVFKAVLLLVLVRIILPGALGKCMNAVRRRLGEYRSPTTYKLLKRYELMKLVPWAAIFLVVFTLFIVQEAILIVGSLVPGDIKIQQGMAIVHFMGVEKAAEVWARFPEAPNLARLAVVIDGIIESDWTSGTLGGYLPVARQAASDSYVVITSCKFVLVWILLCIAISPKARIRRIDALKNAAAGLLILSIVTAYQVDVFLYREYQYRMLAAVVAYNQIVVEDANASGKPSKASVDECLRRVRKELKLRGERSSDWWVFWWIDKLYWHSAFERLTKAE